MLHSHYASISLICPALPGLFLRLSFIVLLFVGHGGIEPLALGHCFTDSLGSTPWSHPETTEGHLGFPGRPSLRLEPVDLDRPYVPTSGLNARPKVGYPCFGRRSIWMAWTHVDAAVLCSFDSTEAADQRLIVDMMTLRTDSKPVKNFVKHFL